jgi:hypothetical protein
MAKAELSVPEIGLIAATRGMLGAGIGLLLADRLKPEERRAVGWTLALVGAVTTVPLVVQVLSSRHPEVSKGTGTEAGPAPSRAGDALPLVGMRGRGPQIPASRGFQRSETQR